MVNDKIRVYGGVASPFARRVRFVLHQLDIPFEAINTLTEAGQAEMRAINPIWKVPCVELDGQVLWDSHTIIEYLLEKHSESPNLLRLPQGDEFWREKKLVSAIDGAVESSINLGYLRMDGVEDERIPYLVKQRLRIQSILSWLKEQLQENYFTSTKQIGLSELAFYCLLDYLRMRNMYSVNDDRVLLDYLNFHADHPGFAATKFMG